MIRLINSFLLGLNPNMQRVVIAIIAIWNIVWKGLALWRSSKKNQKYWFIVLLVINTMGLLEIIYLAFFGRDKKIELKFLKKKKK